MDGLACFVKTLVYVHLFISEGKIYGHPGPQLETSYSPNCLLNLTILTMVINAKDVSLLFANRSKQLINCTTHKLYKQANRGLYSGEKIRHGYYRTKMENKVPRTWSPNVHRVLLFSSEVGKKFRLKVTRTTLKRIDHDGGLDNYILNQKSLESPLAHKLKVKMLEARYLDELSKINLLV